jgi:hypothetical protein
MFLAESDWINFSFGLIVTLLKEPSEHVALNLFVFEVFFPIADTTILLAAWLLEFKFD